MPESADVIICIGTDVSRNGRHISPQSKAITDVAYNMFSRLRAPNVLFCGGYGTQYGSTESSLMSLYFMSRWITEGRNSGLLIGRLRHEDESKRTYQNARFALQKLRKNEWRSAIIVAQQWHVRRVRATFAKQWRGSGIRFAVVKARSPYSGDNSTNRFKSFWRFFLWDTASFILSKVKGWC